MTRAEEQQLEAEADAYQMEADKAREPVSRKLYEHCCSSLESAVRHAERLRVEADRLRNALRHIANQHLVEEMEPESADGADFEDAYEEIIIAARAALKGSE